MSADPSNEAPTGFFRVSAAPAAVAADLQALLDQALAAATAAALSAVEADASADAAVAALASKADAVHTHVMADVTDLAAALALKVDDSQISAFGLTLVDDADAAAAIATLGLGTAATSDTGDFAAAAHTHVAADVTDLAALLAEKVEEAPVDGSPYARIDGAWALSAGGLTDAPSDGTIYGRQDAAWAPISTLLTDAASDGEFYARKDGAWAAVPTRGTVVTVTGTTYTPATGTDGRYFECTNAAGCTVTIPPNADQAFPVGTMLTFEQAGAAQVTIAAGSGVTIRSPSAYTLLTAEQYAVVQVFKKAADTWVLYGNLEAA